MPRDAVSAANLPFIRRRLARVVVSDEREAGGAVVLVKLG